MALSEQSKGTRTMSAGAKHESAYQTELQSRIDAVIPLLVEGKSLRAACRDVNISPSVILDRVKSVPEYGEQYTRAREIGYKLLADEILEIADNGLNDTYTDEQGNVRTDQDVIARSRLRVDSRKWMLSKMLPKIYGDKLELSGDQENPIKTVTRIELVPMSDNRAS